MAIIEIENVFGKSQLEKIDSVFAAWSHLGICFTAPACEQEPDLEQLILDTAICSTRNGRLFTYPVAWLVQFGHLVDFDHLDSLIEAEYENAAPPELAVLCSEIISLGGDKRFGHIMQHCKPAIISFPFFELERGQVIATYVKNHATPSSLKWGRWLESIALNKNKGTTQNEAWILKNNFHLSERQLHSVN